MFRSSRPLVLLLFSGLALGAFKPQDGSVNVYRLPKTQPMPQEASMGDIPAHANLPVLVWDLPEGWAEDEVPGMMQSMSVSLGEDTTASIVELPGSGGGLVANVNRWRGQVGLDPFDEAQIMEDVTTIEGESGPLATIEIIGPERSTFVSLLETPGRTAFIKIIGANDVVAQNKDKFFDFAKSVRYETPGEEKAEEKAE